MGKRASGGGRARDAEAVPEGQGGATNAAETLADVFKDAGLAKGLASSDFVGPDALAAWASLAEQSVLRCIDYRTLGVGWHHPASRTAYRLARHRSFTAPESRKRADASRESLRAAATAVVDGEVEAEVAVTHAFVQEIGLSPDAAPAASATFSGVAAALESELLLPLRALNECDMTETMMGASLPKEELKQVVLSVTQAVLSGRGGFADWRYDNPVGREQLRGLSEQQVALWREPTSLDHARGLRTHEDGPGELGFFWATKIGGPSHGFDYESQCIMPLLANARHKVILVSDPSWPHHPAGRAHWRLLWSAGLDEESSRDPEPRLWLETVNRDFDAEVCTENWELAVLRHAVAKADSMRVALSVEAYLAEDVKRAVKSNGATGQVQPARERMLLRPSNAVVEASDYLSPEHDWVQKAEEVTEPMARVLYVP